MVVAGVVNRDEIGLPEAVERLPKLCFIEVVGGGEVVEPQIGVAVQASEEPGLSGSEVDLGPSGEPFEDSCRLLAAGEDAELAGELGERIGVLRDGERLADAGGRDGVAERQLLDEPRERERDDADRRRRRGRRR